MSRLSVLAAFAVLSFLVTTQVYAASFRAMPMRIYLDNSQKTEVLKIVNEGSERVTIQINIKDWYQDTDGKDLYGETSDLIVFPKMTTVEAGEEKIFRVGYRGGPVVDEKSYRIFVQELPVNKPGATALKFALNLSLPVFVAPKEVHSEWGITVLDVQHEEIKVQVENHGNRHIMVSDIKAVALDKDANQVYANEKSGWYTLSGGSRVYMIELPFQQCLLTDKVKVDVDSKTEQKTHEIIIRREMCARKQQSEKTKKY